MLLQTNNAAYDRFLQDLFTNDTTDSLISGITWGVVGIAGGLAGSFVLISVIWNYAKAVTKGSHNTFSFGELTRVLTVWFSIAIFPLLMSVPSYVADALRIATANLVSEQSIGQYEEYMNLRGNYSANLKNMSAGNNYNNQTTTKQQQTNPDPADQNNNKNVAGFETEIDGAGEPTLWNSILNTFSFEQAMSSIISTFLFICCQIVKMAILAFCISGSKIMLCIGPLAFAFSILPWWKDKIGDWFNFYCTLLFTPVILNIMDAVMMHHVYESVKTYIMQKSDPTTALTSNIIATTAFDLTGVILYIGAFTITSKVVGSSDAGRVFTEGLNTITRAATMATLGPAAAASMGGGGLAGNVAGAGKSALEK